MENPATWGPVEHAINEAMNEHSESMTVGLVGLSLVRVIADRLRAKGLVVDNKGEEAK